MTAGRMQRIWPRRGTVKLTVPFVLPMLDVQAQFSVGRRVAAQLVGDDYPRTAVALEQLAHLPFGRRLIAAALYQHLE
ncbi:hypothetical protein WL42_12455 [Burkholderia ubonensis]|nr:hypothetical protein WL42_12455 [Burkholderia ubonensis]